MQLDFSDRKRPPALRAVSFARSDCGGHALTQVGAQAAQSVDAGDDLELFAEGWRRHDGKSHVVNIYMLRTNQKGVCRATCRMDAEVVCARDDGLSRCATLRCGVEQQFWEQIATEITSKTAAEAVGVSQAAGSRWLRHRSGMPLFMSKPVSARYLSFAERKEIGLMQAQDVGAREIARRIGRSLSTVSR